MSSHQSAAHVSNPAAAVFTPGYPHFKSFMRKGLAHALLLAFGGALAMPALADAINWTDTTGFWDVATNWSSNPLLPGAADDVTIDVAGTQTITVRSPDNITINSLSITGDETLAITGGSLSTGVLNNTGTVNITSGTLNFTGGNSGKMNFNGGVANLTGTLTLTDTVRFSGGQLVGGTVQESGANGLIFTSSGGTLDGVTVRGAMTVGDAVNTSGFVRISNGLTLLTEAGGSPGVMNVGTVAGATGAVVGFTGTQSFDNATINLGNATQSASLSLDAGGTLTLGANAKVQGSGSLGQAYFVGGTNNLINGGTISANQNGRTLTINNSGTFANSGTVEALQGATLSIQPGGGVTNLAGGTLSGGLWRANAGAGAAGQIVFQALNTTITTNAADIYLVGANSAILGHDAGNAQRSLDSTLVTNNGALRLQQGRTFNPTANSGNFTNNGLLEISDSTFTSNNLASNGVVASFGNSVLTTGVGNQVTGSGSIAASFGTLTITRGVNMGAGSSMTSNAGATINLSGAVLPSQIGTLANDGALNLGAQNIVVSQDYTNANFGSGNSFNHRANVTGGGLILAAGDVNQTITGAVSGGTSPTPVISFGNVHVGSNTTLNYQIANTGTTGPSLRGAIQTGINGGNLTDARLTGTGVTAGNFGPVSTGGNSGNLAVTFNASAAGALSGQAVHIQNNFDNVQDQTISIQGAAYNLASGSATPTPITLANQRVGGTNSQVLTVINTAPSGSFTEGLNASFGANTGAATNNAGSINLLAGGASNGSALSVGVDASSAGAKNGTVTLNYVSDGTGSSGLSAIAAGSQTINVSGNVYRLASANTLGAINFGNVHVGDTVQQALSISNTAVNDGFSESLNASFGASSDARIITSGSISQLAAGSSNNSSMIVRLDTSAAGTVNGTQVVNFASDGTGTSGLGITALASQTIGVSGDITTNGNVFRLASASPATPNPVNFGNVRIGTATDQVLSISNTAANDGFSEKLNASISSNGAPVTATGAFNLLGPQATDNTSLHVGIDTSSAGAKSGSATITLVSDGTGTSGLGQTSLPSQTVNVSGNVYRLANGTLNTPSVNLAARVGDASPTAAISISNSSPDVFTEGLNASIGGTASPFTSSGSISNLAAQGTAASALQVGLNTATAGTSLGTATVNFTSTGAGTTGAADVSVGSAVVNLVGKVYQQAVAQVNTLLVDFGIVHRGDAVAPIAVSVSNTAPVAGLNDVLQGSLGGASGPFSASGTLGAGVAAGATDSSSLTVALDTSATGVFNGSATASLTSHNADMADLVVGGIPVVLLSAQVNDFANADLRKIGGEGSLSRSALQIVLDFGNVTQGSGTHSTSLEVFNNVAGLGDLLDGQFSFIDANDFLFSGFNSFADLAAGSHTGSLGVSFDAVNLGAFSDTIVLASRGHNASGFSGALPDVTLLIKANVTAGSTVPEPESLLLMAIGMAALIASRRRARMN